MDYQDRVLLCASCGEEFVFSAREQEFFTRKGFTHLPRRCRRCKKGGTAQAREKLAASNRSHRTRCTQCGRPTTVPFAPAPGRPVFCRSCFDHRRTSVRPSGA